VVQLPAWLKDDKARQEKIDGKKDAKGEVVEMGGRQLFTERGCLACHQHTGTATAGSGLPAATSTADFGPNLSDLAAKIAPAIDDPDAKWRWLVQWIMNPNVHFPRTRMPVTHLTEDEAARIAAWLLSQPTKEWKQPDPPAPDEKVLERLARVYLDKAMGARIEGAAVIEHRGLTEAQEAALKDRGPDADELRLATSRSESWPDKLKWYVGRKAITQLGCYGCHDIPGFEFAKPVGTPLNDWGKKDAERIAFEDAIAWVKKNYHVVASRDNPRDPNKPSIEWRNKTVTDPATGQETVKKPYEQFFFEALDHHHREGFLHQKLVEPRSYDYDRMRNWDERLRMPQFHFSRKVVPEGASAEDIAQAQRDEAADREAVMTFILGLIAEPIPTNYLYAPGGDKEAVVKGKHVLEKYNCAGCHHLDAGRYEFKLNDAVRDALNAKAYSKDNELYADDHREPFKAQNEWTGQLGPDPNALTIVGMPDPRDPHAIRLTEAARFINNAKEVRDVPASNNFKLDDEDLRIQMLSRTEPTGGAFVNVLVPYLGARDSFYSDYIKARAALPPPLLRQGEKAQPEWLFQFLRDPQKIRPMTVLRMPKFNMSDDDARTLVNYFAAADRLSNPGGGLDHPYVHIPQRQDSFWREHTAQYVERLKKNNLLDERKKAMQPILGDNLTPWLEEGAYAADAFRLMSNPNNACMGCHSVGGLKAKNPEREQGPPLDLSWQRLRPEWTARWLANPDRMISYPTPMPSNFTRKDKYTEFDGSQIQQIFAVRDVLMFFPKVADMAANREQKPATGTDEKK
jgi:mono/diheme cytochrome c family protein